MCGEGEHYFKNVLTIFAIELADTYGNGGEPRLIIFKCQFKNSFIGNSKANSAN